MGSRCMIQMTAIASGTRLTAKRLIQRIDFHNGEAYSLDKVPVV